MGHMLLQAGQKGVYIRRVEPTAPASSWLHEGDILMSFEGTDIANDGTVPFRSGERISFSYLISQKYTDEQVSSPSPPLLTPCSRIAWGTLDGPSGMASTAGGHVALKVAWHQQLCCPIHAPS